MATKTYKCTNYGDCDLALSNELVEIEDGEDIVCPGCSKTTLVEPSERAKGATGSRSKLGIAGIVAVLMIGLVWVLWPSPPDPELADTLLSEFFPKLPK